jgi:hypothetical protein
VKSKKRTRNLNRRNQRAQACLLLKKEFSIKDENKSNALLLEDIIAKALPMVEREFGKGTMQYTVFVNCLSMLGKSTPEGLWKGAHYCDEVITFPLFLLQRCYPASCEQIAALLHLPSRRHMQQINVNEVEDDGDGPCDAMIAKAWEEVGLAYDEHSRDVILAFDSMKMRRGMMISTGK